jgi:hypothetical protein
MLDTNKKTLRTHPSLLPLRMALTAAESGSPSRPPFVTADERCALDLIQKMKTEYSKPLPFTSFVHRTPKSLTLGVSNTKHGDFVFNLREVIGSYV